MTISLHNLLNQPCSGSYPGLRRRLLTLYLVAMAAIHGISALTLYVFFSRSLHKQLNEQLLTLVEAASPSLDSVKTKGRQSLDRSLPWRNLFTEKKQSLEWFDADGNLLAQEGSDFPQFSLVTRYTAVKRRCLRVTCIPQVKLPSSFWHDTAATLNEAPIIQQQGRLRSATIRVYADSDGDKLRLEGYIRASQSTQDIAATLSRLRVGLELGSITAWVAIGLGGIYLTRQALVPTVKSIQQLEGFTTQVSHHLRTPLTRISLAVELLLSDGDQFQRSQSSKLEIISGAVAQITRLIDDLLFLTRTESASTFSSIDLAGSSSRSHRLPSESTAYLGEILDNLATSLQVIAEKKGIELQTHLLSNPAVKGNTTLLRRLFSNLLENAIAYTEPGGSVVVSLEMSRQHAVVSVADTGIGIAPKFLPLVFERFWRSEQAQIQRSAGTTADEGLGLGLAVAQAIVEQHRGKITVSSEVGIGSCFQIHLPLI